MRGKRKACPKQSKELAAGGGLRAAAFEPSSSYQLPTVHSAQANMQEASLLSRDFLRQSTSRTFKSTHLVPLSEQLALLDIQVVSVMRCLGLCQHFRSSSFPTGILSLTRSPGLNSSSHHIVRTRTASFDSDLDNSPSPDAKSKHPG